MKFVDLSAQYQAYKQEIDEAMQQVIDTAAFINGPDVRALEEELAAYCGAEHAIACSSGTDALLIPFAAMDLQPEDEVIVPAFTYIASASMISFWGARPVFVDVDEVTFNLDPEAVSKAVTPRTKGIVAVSLFGQCPDLDSLQKIADEHHLWILEDGAQSFGARYHGHCSCSMTDFATTSFFPAKPLGCYGDGGAVFTGDPEMAARMRMFLSHGQEKRYHHAMIGINGRMDTLQAAIVRVKLKHFEEELTSRNAAADYYTRELTGIVETPRIREGDRSTWAQYTIKSARRDRIRTFLQELGVPTAVHYPLPLHHQKAFAYLQDSGPYPVAERLSMEVLSLPMHPFITDEQLAAVVQAVKESLA